MAHVQLKTENFLVCPITQELFVDPVLAEDGHTYERSAITRWFGTGNTRSPVTNEELEGKRLVANHVIKKIVHHHRSSLGERLVGACDNGDDPAVVELIERGADLNFRNDAGETPLLILIARNRVNVARELIRAGADASLANDRGETPEAAARRRRLDESFIVLLQEASRTASLKRASEAESRIRERDEYRRLQELRRAENGENRGTGTVPLVQGVGFFPSLFGLQFQGSLVAGGNVVVPTISPHTTGSLTISQRLTNWARINIAGDPELAVGHEDHIQQQVLSRALLTVGSLVLLCLLCT
jgi:U-box domain